LIQRRVKKHASLVVLSSVTLSSCSGARVQLLTDLDDGELAREADGGGGFAFRVGRHAFRCTEQFVFSRTRAPRHHQP
jgi:hypothetical protein